MSPPSPSAALVTGGGQRIGAALALALARAGWFVHVHYRRSRAEAASVVAAIREAGGGARTVQADLARLDAKAAAALIRDCAKAGPSLRALLNNAALFENDSATSFTAASWRRHMATNLEAPILLARAFAAALPRRGPAGAVVNLLDNKVVSTNPDFFSYTVSKQALFGATQTLALALAPRVRVNGIAPGITLISGKQSAAGFGRAHDANPLRRGCTPQDVARAALFLLDTPAITGQTLVIDGGASLARPPRDIAFL